MRKFCFRVLYITILNVCIGFAYRYASTKDVQVLNTKLTIRKLVSEIRDIPHHVLIVYGNYYCSGTLINSKIAVTAATCFIKYRGGAVVKVGADSVTGFGQIIPVKEIKIHEYFGHLSSLDNDIAMVMFKQDVLFGGKISKAVLIESDLALYEGSELDVSGYGGNGKENESSTNYHNSLLVSKLFLLSKSVCTDIFGNFITASNFCAEYYVDQRLNDNGGGALHDGVLVGILSYDAIEIKKPMVAIFTNISYFHRWVKLNTMRFMKKFCLTVEEEADSSETDDY